MKNKVEEIDKLTGIYNETYLNNYYQEYITQNPDSNFIMFDLQNFKHLNDTYGHNTGDSYLKVFGNTIKEAFPEGIACRIHGDEFVVVTNKKEEQIERTLDNCQKVLDKVEEQGIIPIKFNFNAGSTLAEENIEETMEKADSMMYFAKKYKKSYQAFSNLIWKSRMNENYFIEMFTENLEKENFTYTLRRIHNLDGKCNGLNEINTKSKIGTAFLDDHNYDLLRKNSKISKLDELNMPKLIERFENMPDKTLINIDYKTLVTPHGLVEYKNYLPFIISKDLSKIVLGINVKGMNQSDYPSIIKNIHLLKQFDFDIALTRYDGSVGNEIWENSDIDYIKFDTEYWKKTQENPKLKYSLEKKLDMFTNYEKPTIPIFAKVKTEEESDYVKSISPEISLVSGDYYSPKRKVFVKTRKTN